MKQPEYYKSNGLSPIDAFKQGLISKEEYKGFLIGNVIKYVIRAGKKDDVIKDLNKAKHYLDFYIELESDNELNDYGYYNIKIENEVEASSTEIDTRVKESADKIK